MHHRSNLSDLSIVLFESVHGQDHVHVVRLGRLQWRRRWRAAKTYDVHNGAFIGLVAGLASV